MSAGFETKSSDTKKRNRRQAHPAKVASIEAIELTFRTPQCHNR